jgi:hypothetical protein
MSLFDRLRRPRGRVELRVFRRGVLVDHWIDRNLVVDNSKLLLSRLAGGDVTNRSLTQIQFGTNGSAPAAGNTAITSPFSKALDSHAYPDGTSVSFAFSLGSSENNGMAILEFGLVSADGTLFARKTRSSALNKDSDITVSGSWVIQF